MGFSFGAHLFLTASRSVWSKDYNPALYWIVILSTSTAGTTLSDFLIKPHAKVGLDFGTIGSSAVLVVMIVGASYAQRRYVRRDVAELS